MDGDEGDGEWSARQAHGEVLRPAPRGKKFGLTGKSKPRIAQWLLRHRAGDDALDFAGREQRGGFFQRFHGSARRVLCRAPRTMALSRADAA